MARTAPPIARQKRPEMEALIKPKYQAHGIPLEEALNYTKFTGRNYGGPRFPCGMCKWWRTAVMLPKDADGNTQSALTHRRCTTHPDAPLDVERDVALKCPAFWMAETFYHCDKLEIGVHPRACAWRRHHGVEKECRDCGQGRRMVKWMAWVGYSIPKDKDNIIMRGLVEEMK